MHLEKYAEDREKLAAAPLAAAIPLAGKLLWGGLTALGLYEGGKQMYSGGKKLMRGERGGLGDLAGGALMAGFSAVPSWGAAGGIKALGRIGAAAGSTKAVPLATKALRASHTIGKPFQRGAERLGGAMLSPFSAALGWKPGAGAKAMAGSIGGAVGIPMALNAAENTVRGAPKPTMHVGPGNAFSGGGFGGGNAAFPMREITTPAQVAPQHTFMQPNSNMWNMPPGVQFGGGYGQS